MLFTQQRGIPLLLLASFLLSGCSGFITPLKTTPTPPMAQRDLSKIVLQSNELPPGFDIYLVDKLEGVFPNVAEAHSGVTNSCVIVTKTQDSKKVYSSGIIVFEGQEQAKKAYQAIIKGNRKDTAVHVDPIGEETYGMEDVVQSEALAHEIYIGMVLWRYQETVLYISSADSLTPVDSKQMILFAQQIHKRLTETQ